MASHSNDDVAPPLDRRGGSRHGAGMTLSELCDLLIRDIVRTHGGGTARWRKVIGAMKLYDRATHPHCNWDVRPTGTAHEVAVVERASDALRARHPFAEAG